MLQTNEQLKADGDSLRQTLKEYERLAQLSKESSKETTVRPVRRLAPASLSVSPLPLMATPSRCATTAVSGSEHGRKDVATESGPKETSVALLPRRDSCRPSLHSCDCWLSFSRALPRRLRPGPRWGACS